MIAARVRAGLPRPVRWIGRQALAAIRFALQVALLIVAFVAAMWLLVGIVIWIRTVVLISDFLLESHVIGVKKISVIIERPVADVVGEPGPVFRGDDVPRRPVEDADSDQPLGESVRGVEVLSSGRSSNITVHDLPFLRREIVQSCPDSSSSLPARSVSAVRLERLPGRVDQNPASETTGGYPPHKPDHDGVLVTNPRCSRSPLCREVEYSSCDKGQWQGQLRTEREDLQGSGQSVNSAHGASRRTIL